MRGERDLWRWLRERPGLADALLTAVLIAVSVPSLWVTTSYLTVDLREPDLFGVLLTVVSCLPVAWRRRTPVEAFVAAGIPSVALAGFGYVQALGGIPVLVLLYSVAAYGERRASLACLAWSYVATVVVLRIDRFPESPIDYLASTAIFTSAWAFGRGLRIRRAYVVELEGRAHQLQAAREADTRAALAQERSRIARELHDVVAHHVSVMTVQAAAAQRTLDRDPLRAREAMAAVEQTGRAALVEMRRIVGVLRDDGEPAAGLEPQPGVADIATLVDQVREAGLEVTLAVDGEPVPLPAGVDLAVFRVVQEALTNSLKHAGPSRALVRVRYADAAVEVRVTDTGRGAAAALGPPSERPGHGLLGMRERVRTFGGRLETGPRAGGGYEVRASFPLEPVAS